MLSLTGFANAMAEALEGKDYRTYGYCCAGAIGYGSTGSWTSAFGQVDFTLMTPSIHHSLFGQAWWHNTVFTCLLMSTTSPGLTGHHVASPSRSI